MRISQSLLCAALLVACAQAQSPAPAPDPVQDAPILRVNSTLVFLDVTVLDKHGVPVVTGLTRDDFVITENRQPQRIFSFEPPDAHRLDTGIPGSEGKPPVNIYVLDGLNSRPDDFAYYLYSFRKYLESQPERLSAPAELFLVGNTSLELVQSFTLNRNDLLDAVRHLPFAYPYKAVNPSFSDERFSQSYSALEQITLDGQGIPGRKNIVWLGVGGPAFSVTAIDPFGLERLQRYVHSITNMLSDSRASLFVIYPSLKVARTSSGNVARPGRDVTETNPFEAEFSFAMAANETGGKFYDNHNDIDYELQESRFIGSRYYTLTYQPHDVPADGKFRHIRVTVPNHDYRVIAKTGYFAPDAKAPKDPDRQAREDLVLALKANIPFPAVSLKVDSIARHSDAQTVELILWTQAQNLSWSTTEPGAAPKAEILLAAATRSKGGSILSSKLQSLKITAVTSPAPPPNRPIGPFKLTLRLPAKAQNIRVVLATEGGSRIGTVDISRSAIDSAPDQPTPDPQLTHTAHVAEAKHGSASQP